MEVFGCVDYRKVNEVTVQDAYSLPHMDDIVNLMVKATFVSKLDLLKVYYQVPLTGKSKGDIYVLNSRSL